MKELWKILWVESGWAILTVPERIKMLYFCISLFAVIVFAETNLWLLGLSMVNLAIAAKVVKTIKTEIPDD